MAKTYVPRERRWEGISFVWEGGAYIDVLFNGGYTSSCINVWDYAADRSEIPFTDAALAKEADAWLWDNAEDIERGLLTEV